MSDLLKKYDPKGELRGEYSAEPGNGWEASLAILDRHGLLRDPQEPTLDEVRLGVRALPMSNDPYPLIQRDAVLALLEPKKPEPTYKPGDWVFIPGLGVRLVINSNNELSIDHNQGTGYPAELDRLARYIAVRFATAEEIARARGEAA